MSSEDRKSLGKAGMTTHEASHSELRKAENILQVQIARLLDQRGIFFSRARMDKRTTVRVGMFDFTIYLPTGKYLAVEVKAPGGTLSQFQEKVFAEFWSKTGQVVHIVFNLEAFRQLLDANT